MAGCDYLKRWKNFRLKIETLGAGTLRGFIVNGVCGIILDGAGKLRAFRKERIWQKTRH